MTDDLSRLAADFAGASVEAHATARAVVQKGALNVKTEARLFASGLAHAPLYPLSITYDTRDLVDGPEARIGPDKDKPQGALGNLLEYGSVNNAPVSHLGPALDREGPGFERALGDAGERLL